MVVVGGGGFVNRRSGEGSVLPVTALSQKRAKPENLITVIKHQCWQGCCWKSNIYVLFLLGAGKIYKHFIIAEIYSTDVQVDKLQSTLVISKSKGPSETLRDIRTSTYQMCRIEENTKRATKFHKWTCNLTPLLEIYVENIVEKGRNCSWGAISPLIHNVLLPDIRFLCENKDQIFSLR